jgi:RNA polymerase sigma-70 factor, ECF subfamily
MKTAPECACAQRGRLYAAARRQGLAPEDAKDAVQEALSSFVALSKDRCGDLPFLTAMVINVARNMRRRHHRAKPHARGPVLEVLSDERPRADEALELVDRAQVVHRCLDRLEDVPRKIVALRIIEDVSGNEVAKLLDLSPSNVAVMLHRAKRSLSSCLLTSEL